MVRKKSSLIIAAIVTIFSFITVAYISCSKSGNNWNTCDNVVCQNGGYCYVDTNNHNRVAVCVCPTGYEGSNCATASVNKFLNTWDMTQTDIGSDSAGSIGLVYKYTVSLQPTATPTTFFINNLSNDPYYYNIICTLDSTQSNNQVNQFYMDTISAFHMVYDHYRILYGGGTINNNYDTISGTFATRHLSPTTNWINDTFTITLVLHKF
jgi:hypothetical protein